MGLLIQRVCISWVYMELIMPVKYVTGRYILINKEMPDMKIFKMASLTMWSEYKPIG